MKALQPLIYGIIKEECHNTEKGGKYPLVTPETTILARVNEAARIALKELKADGLITSYENVNRIPMYQIANKKDEE